MGAKRWSAPEFWDNTQKKTTKGDIYSFGVILWELLTRQLPWEDVLEEDEIGEKILAGKTLEIPSFVPKRFKDILEKCWQLRNTSDLLYSNFYRTFTSTYI